MKQFKFNPRLVALVCAVAVLCVGFLSTSVFAQTKSKIIVIPLSDVDEATWDEYGPGHEGDPLSPISIWMRAAGNISFKFDIDDLKGRKSALVSVKLASELGTDLQGKVNGNPKYSSDVTLFVNDDERLTQNISADDMVGKYYAWKIPIEALKKGENTLTFTIKQDAKNRNGLTIFTPIKIQLR